jgi:hypothetical protein
MLGDEVLILGDELHQRCVCTFADCNYSCERMLLSAIEAVKHFVQFLADRSQPRHNNNLAAWTVIV